MAATESSTRAMAALDDLYRRHVGDVYRYTYAVLGNHADAEDVTQTTFVNALRALERGEQPREPSHWLLAIAHNLVRQRWRQAAARPTMVELVQDVPDDEPGDDDVQLDELVRALQRIPTSQREALVMRELEGRSYKEIAELLGLTTSALETLLFRARRSLAEELENLVTCQSAELALSRDSDGRLSRKERKRLDDHIAECPSCARFSRTAAAAAEGVQGPRDAAAPRRVGALPRYADRRSRNRHDDRRDRRDDRCGHRDRRSRSGRRHGGRLDHRRWHRRGGITPRRCGGQDRRDRRRCERCRRRRLQGRQDARLRVLRSLDGRRATLSRAGATSTETAAATTAGSSATTSGTAGATLPTVPVPGGGAAGRAILPAEPHADAPTAAAPPANDAPTAGGTSPDGGTAPGAGGSPGAAPGGGDTPAGGGAPGGGTTPGDETPAGDAPPGPDGTPPSGGTPPTGGDSPTGAPSPTSGPGQATTTPKGKAKPKKPKKPKPPKAKTPPKGKPTTSPPKETPKPKPEAPATPTGDRRPAQGSEGSEGAEKRPRGYGPRASADASAVGERAADRHGPVIRRRLDRAGQRREAGQGRPRQRRGPSPASPESTASLTRPRASRRLGFYPVRAGYVTR